MMRKKKRSIYRKIHISDPKIPEGYPLFPFKRNCTVYECVQRASDLKDILISRKTGNELKKFICRAGGMNMFGIQKLNNKTINRLANIIETIVMEQHQKPISRLRKAKLKQDIKVLYNKVKNPTLSDFCDICTDTEIKEKLQKFCCVGKYGKIFDKIAKNNITSLEKELAKMTKEEKAKFGKAILGNAGVKIRLKKR